MHAYLTVIGAYLSIFVLAVKSSPKELHRIETVKTASNFENRTSRASISDGSHLPAASEDQLQEMCRKVGCRYNNRLLGGLPVVVVYNTVNEFPQIVRYLTTRGIAMRGIRLLVKNWQLNLRKIARIGGPSSMVYEFLYKEAEKSLQLGVDDKTYITQGIEKLELDVGSHMLRIDGGFFSKFFPNLKSLEITGSIDEKPTAMEELHLGFLPYLRYMKIHYPINGDLVGCSLPEGELSCFYKSLTFVYSDGQDVNGLGKQNVLQTNLRLLNLRLPEFLSAILINLLNAKLTSTNAFEDKTIGTLNLKMASTEQVAGISFKGSVVQGEISVDSGNKDETFAALAKNLDGILHNPSIAAKWKWKRGNELLYIPVVFGTASEQEFQNVNTAELVNKTCTFSNRILEYANNQVISGMNRDKVVYRAFYVDLTLLIDSIASKGHDISELHVTTFHLHLSASRNVSFILHVSYMKITTKNNAVIGQVYNEKISQQYKNIDRMESKGSSGSELQWRNSVDAIFAQAFVACTAIILTQEKNLGSTVAMESSLGNAMWSYALPSTLQGADDEIAKAQQLLTKVGECVEYLSEAAAQKATRVPYLSLQYQQENIGLLLYIAQGLIEEQQSKKVMHKMENIREDVLDRQDQSTLSLLNTEYKRTVSLVLISARRAHDIQKKLDAAIELVSEVNSTFYSYKADMEKENKTFVKGIERAKAFAYADVASAIASSVISFFSGGFDPGKLARAAKKLKDMTIKLKRLMDLTKIFTKLAKLIQTLRNIQQLSTKATGSINGRVGRLFKALKSYQIKRHTYLTDLIRKSNALPFQKKLLLKEEVENKRQIDKYTKILERVQTTRNSVEYLQNIMDGIVDAQKAVITLKDMFKPENYSRNTAPQGKISAIGIEDELEDEFMQASGNDASVVNELSEVLRDYSLDKSKNVIAEGEKLNAADVLEWDVANANVEGTMDASLSIDIPETTSFKAALFKMNLAGKLKTQAMIDEAAIRVDLDRARFETTTYLREGAEILKKIRDIEKLIELRQNRRVKAGTSSSKELFFQMKKSNSIRNEWKEFSVKLSILIATLTYCSSYYYFHLNPCPSEYSFDFSTSLRDVVQMQRELQRQSLLQLEDFYPPPQTMQNRSIVFKKPNTTCLCMRDVTRTSSYQDLYSGWKKCQLKEPRPTSMDARQSPRLLQNQAMHCEINKVLEMQEFHRISVEISINDSLAKDHSRVRVDDMKVILHGAKTSSGVITVSIESSGLSEDRYAGDTFAFYGDKWRRDFSYFSQQSKIESADEGMQDWHVLDAANVYKSFKGVYRTATLFTTWIITVDPERNPGLNLAGLHTIELQFSGSFVAAGDYKHTKKKGNSLIDRENEVASEMPFRRGVFKHPDIVNYDENDEEWYTSM